MYIQKYIYYKIGSRRAGWPLIVVELYSSWTRGCNSSSCNSSYCRSSTGNSRFLSRFVILSWPPSSFSLSLSLSFFSPSVLSHRVMWCLHIFPNFCDLYGLSNSIPGHLLVFDPLHEVCRWKVEITRRVWFIKLYGI